MSNITKIKKRSGEVADFVPEKISAAVGKAFAAVKGEDDEVVVESIAAEVVEMLEARYQAVEAEDLLPDVEEVQDLVEQQIMAAGYFDVAKAYIVYRFDHAKVRTEKAEELKEETEEKLEKNKLYVVKRSGERERFSIKKIKQTLQYAAAGLSDVDIDGLAAQVEREVYDDITSAEIGKALIMAVRSWIERDPAYSDLAARLLHQGLYKEMGINGGKGKADSGREVNFERNYRKVFIQNIKKAVKIGKLDERLLEYDLAKLSKVIKPERDNLLKYLGAQTLYDRYYIQNPETKEILETPQTMWMRVAMGLALPEKNKEEWAIKFYEMMSDLRYIPSTPTLFHSGTTHPQLSSCYLNTVSDDLTHIFKVIGDNAQLSKWSGGIGTDWSSLRGTGALIKGTGVESQGVIPFLKVSNDATHAINRSGRRRGAACVYLETWHYDIESFLELRKNTGDERRRTHDIDTANWIPDLFMKRVRADADWTLFSPDEVPELHEIYGKAFEKHYQYYEKLADQGKIKLFKRLKAKDLWKKMLAMLFETGHPWITWKDPSNVRSPQDHVGVVHNSNLCTEITLNTSAEETAVCNLGSVNLSRHIKGGEGKVESGGELNVEKVAETVQIAMRMLDNVVDVNFYPTIEAKNSNMKHRPVGLGIMGVQDALFQIGINYDSEAAVEFADYSMEVISWWAYYTSSQIAKEKGAYKSYKGSKWDRGILPQDTIALLEKERGEKIGVDKISRLNWGEVRESIKKYGMRNSNCMAIAPTATIANIAGSVPGGEPIYKNIYVKANVSGDFIVINPYMVTDFKKLNLWNSAMLDKIKYHDGSIRDIIEIPLHIREKYKETFEIDPTWIIKASAHRGKWIDQSQSMNIYFQGTSGAKISEVYFYAWEMGLKTTYYLRTMAKTQVEKSTVDTAAFGSTHQRQVASSVRVGESESARVGSQKEAIIPAVISTHSEPAVGRIEEGEKSHHIQDDAILKADTETETPNTKYQSPNTISTPHKLCLLDDPTCESCQ